MAKWGKVCTNRAAGTLSSILLQSSPSCRIWNIHFTSVGFFLVFAEEETCFHLHNLKHGASRSMILFVCSTKQEGSTLSTESPGSQAVWFRSPTRTCLEILPHRLEFSGSPETVRHKSVLQFIFSLLTKTSFLKFLDVLANFPLLQCYQLGTL